MNPITDLTSILFPARCHVCDTRLSSQESYLCQHCIDNLPRTLFHRSNFNPMEQRFAGKIKYEKATAHFYFIRESKFSSIIHDFKYRNFPSLAKYIGIITARELISTGFFNDIDILIPIPLHFFKLLKRGYNQSEMIAKGINTLTGIKINTSLKAVKSRKTQTLKNSFQRWENTQNAFTIKNANNLQGKHILLIDDVCTTGATIIAAAKEILKIKNTKVSILTISATQI